MAIKQLTIDSLGEFNNGAVAKAFQLHAKRAIADCEDRPGETKSRTITIQVEFEPVVLQEGACTDAAVTVKIKSGIPTHVAAPVTCMIRKGGIASWNDMSEGDPSQMTFE